MLLREAGERWNFYKYADITVVPQWVHNFINPKGAAVKPNGKQKEPISCACPLTGNEKKPKKLAMRRNYLKKITVFQIQGKQKNLG